MVEVSHGCDLLANPDLAVLAWPCHAAPRLASVLLVLARSCPSPGLASRAEIRFRATPEEMLRLHPAMAPNAFEPSHVIPPLPKLASSC